MASRKSIAQRLAEVPDGSGLKDGYKCPICKKDFKNQYACKHSYNDVAKHNARKRALLQEERTKEIVKQAIEEYLDVMLPVLIQERIDEMFAGETADLKL